MSVEAELLDKFFKRVHDWRLNSGNARISVPVGEMRAAADLIAKLRAEVDRLKTYEVELRRIATDVGEPDDPFAAWESISYLLRDRPAIIATDETGGAA